MSAPAAAQPWPGWPVIAWRSARWVIALSLLGTLLLLVGLSHRPFTSQSPTWATLTTDGAAFALQINAVFAIFMPLVTAARFGTWGLRPLARSMVHVTILGWLATTAVFVLTLLLWMVLTR